MVISHGVCRGIHEAANPSHRDLPSSQEALELESQDVPRIAVDLNATHEPAENRTINEDPLHTSLGRAIDLLDKETRNMKGNTLI